MLPYGMDITIGDFNICEPEEGSLNVPNRTFSDGGSC